MAIPGLPASAQHHWRESLRYQTPDNSHALWQVGNLDTLAASVVIQVAQFRYVPVAGLELRLERILTPLLLP